ncbi:hypothetical protein NPIL_624891 [Nephila pilipes]|uniref:Uncharacterized protein n=1 Tax=Nephila pilipes TaxID=299642 RepID=A0A8X6N9Y3_NEPPI|nr:hypothetical protein NPIL_624891 [Nephila pilipes]
MVPEVWKCGKVMMYSSGSSKWCKNVLGLDGFPDKWPCINRILFYVLEVERFFCQLNVPKLHPCAIGTQPTLVKKAIVSDRNPEHSRGPFPGLP